MILKLNASTYINTEQVASVDTHKSSYGDVFQVHLSGGRCYGFRPDSDEAGIIREWLTGRIVDRLETCDDGELQNIQTDAHEAGIGIEQLRAKQQERRERDQRELEAFMDREDKRNERIRRIMARINAGDRIAQLDGVPF